ncbi:MAG: HPr family phosphocarrier protein [Halanaerobiaceae bacterium]
MIKKDFEINAPTGLHARPAATFVELASKYEAKIKIVFEGQEVNAKSIISVLSLGLGDGEEFELVIEGPDEKEALAEIKRFMEEKLCLSEESYDDIIGQNYKGTNQK